MTMTKITISSGHQEVYRGLVFCADPMPQNPSLELISVREQDPDIIFLMFDGYHQLDNPRLDKKFPRSYLKVVRQEIANLISKNYDKFIAHVEELTAKKAVELGLSPYRYPGYEEEQDEEERVEPLTFEEFLPKYLELLPKIVTDSPIDLRDFCRYLQIPHVKESFTRLHDRELYNSECYYFYRDGRKFTSAARECCSNHTRKLEKATPETKYIVETVISSQDGLTIHDLRNSSGKLNFVIKDLNALLARTTGKYEVIVPKAVATPPPDPGKIRIHDYKFTDEEIKIFVNSLKEAQNINYYYKNRLGWDRDLVISAVKSNDHERTT